MSLGTRAHRIGSIYSRVKNLLNAGLMRHEDKPLWYDIYEAFPPKREPVFIPGPQPDEFGQVGVEDTVRPLLYKEDWARASLTKLYNDFSSVYDLEDSGKDPNISETFVQTYKNLQKLHPEMSKEELFEKSEDALSIKRSLVLTEDP